MEKSLDSRIRSLLIAIGAVALVILGVWFLFRGSGRKPTAVLPKKVPVVQKETRTNSFDTDGDGLLDWEEALWGTDPNNPDADGDGTSDGAEVAAHRNPKKAGPNDSLDTPLMIIEQEEKPFVRRRIPAPAPQIQTNTPLLPVSPEQNTETSENPLHVFGNALGALIEMAAADATAELAFWNSAAGNKKMTPELLQGFAKLAGKYEKLASDIAAVAPPEKAGAVHASLTDAYRNYAKAVRMISETPVGSYMSGPAITAYSNATLALGHAVVAVSDLFYRERIGFGKNESGNVFSFPR